MLFSAASYLSLVILEALHALNASLGPLVFVLEFGYLVAHRVQFFELVLEALLLLSELLLFQTLLLFLLFLLISHLQESLSASRGPTSRDLRLEGLGLLLDGRS